MTNWKALCAELLSDINGLYVELTEGAVGLIPPEAQELMDRARAALAESDGPAVPDGREPASVNTEPSGPIPADGEVAELVTRLEEMSNEAVAANQFSDSEVLDRVVDLLERLSPPPQAAELEYTKPNCADCGGPIGQDKGPLDGWQLEDGRTVCHSCCVIDFRGIVDAALGSP